MWKFLFTSLAVFTAVTASSQDLSNKGKNFWICYPAHIDSTNSAMGIYITSDVNATGQIDVAGTIVPFTVTANTVTYKFVGPNAGGSAGNIAPYLNQQDGIKTGAGIHVTSDKDVAVYAHIIKSARSGATLVLPTKVWGKEYMLPSYKHSAATGYGELVVMASLPNTIVEITPAVNTRSGRPAGVPFQVTLPNPGDVYQLQFANTLDLSGTRVKSLPTGGIGCLPIAVYSATTFTSFGCGGANTGDNLYQQIFPIGAWGKQFLTSPLKRIPTNPVDFNTDIIRVFVNDPTTVVTKTQSGVTTTLAGLISNTYYEYTSSEPTFLNADKPIQVVEYIATQSCGNPQTQSDPEMIVLNSVEQTINDITVFSAHQNFVPPGQSQVTTHYLNVIMKTVNTPVFKINGVAPVAAFITIPGTAYSYLKEDISTRAATNPVSRLTADSGFSAIAYGFGQVESYGYNAGTNVKDLYQQIGVSTEYGIETTPSVCTNSPFRFKVSLPYIPDSMFWDFHNAAGMLPSNANVMVDNTGNIAEDSATVVNGKTIHWYSLPTLYSFTTIGVYPVTITTYVPNGDCGTTQEINFDLTVSDPPIAGFTYTAGGCYAEPYQFTETTAQFPKATYRWWWDFGDPGSGANNNSFARNPTHTFSTPGPHTIKYSAITTPGCLSDTIQLQVNVPDLPSATISGNTTVCINSTPEPIVTFTATEGTSPYTFTYNINGGLAQTVSSVFPSNTATVTAPTNIAGPFTYNLSKVQNSGSSLCVQNVAGQSVLVNITPDATVTLQPPSNNNQTVCINTIIADIKYNIGGSGNGGTVSGLPAGVTGTYAVGVITIAGTPTQSGVFIYTIHPTGLCAIPVPDVTGTITVTEDGTLALSSAAGTDAQELCRNSTLINITYAFGGSATGASVAGLPPGVSFSVTGNRLTITGSPTLAGSFTYTVSTSGPCVKPMLTGNILVDELPTANFSFSTPSCQTRQVNFTDLSIANTGGLTNWQWDFADGSPIDNNQNPVHSFANAGTYNVLLTVTTSKGCISNPSSSIPVTISARPLAGYIIPAVCLSDTYAQFYDTSTVAGGTINNWAWNFGDPGSGINNSSTLQNPQHSYTAVGTYPVQLIVTSTAGCIDTIQHNLSVNGSFPVADFNVTAPANLCANDSVAIVNTSSVFPGIITKIEIYWDNVGAPLISQIDTTPYPNKMYQHLYPNFQAPLTKTFTIRYRAYSGGVCVNDKFRDITVNAAPRVQFNAIPDICLFAAPYQITQASEIGGVPGSGTYSGAGVSTSGLFTPTNAGVGTHTILYTFTSSAAGCVDTMSNTISVLDTAHAVFTFASPSCEQVPISFTDMSTAPAGVVLDSTIWNFGDGTAIESHASGSTFTHVFALPNTYTVTMHNVSTYGCLSSDTFALITIAPNHHITLLSANNNQTICINTPILPIAYKLSGGATTAMVSNLPPGLLQAVSGDTLTISGSPTSTLNSPYNFTIQTTGNTCVVDNAAGSITVNPDHTITLTSGNSTQSVCVNTAINSITYNLGGGASGATITGLPAGITYSVAAGILTIAGTPVTTVGGPSFPYAITTTGNSCVKANITGEIKVNPYPVPSFSVDKPAYCIPNAVVQFTNNSLPSTSLLTFVWDFGDGPPLSSGINPTHQYLSTDTFYVKLTATSLAVLNGNIIGCAHDTTIAITTIHPQPKADFVFNKPSVCLGDNVIITDNTDGKDGIVNQWHWDLGDGTTQSINPVNKTFKDTVTYNVTMYTINSFGCNSDTVTKPFTVYPYPYVNAGPDRFVLEGGQIQLESISYGNDLQYAWTPVQYLNNSSIPNPVVKSPATDMTYRLTVTARGGCISADEVLIKLLKFPSIPNTFTPNNDGINDTWRIDYLNSYPDNRVQIFTRSGTVIFESKGYSKPWDGTFKGKPLPFDTYYYIIEPGSGRDPITGYVTILK